MSLGYFAVDMLLVCMYYPDVSRTPGLICSEEPAPPNMSTAAVPTLPNVGIVGWRGGLLTHEM
jgi:hypothetical protein